MSPAMNGSVSPTVATSQIDSTAILEVLKVGFRYGAKIALDDVSMTLNPGEFHALLGPNGAGKSTLFNLISRLYQVQNGEIRLQGQDLGQHGAKLLEDVGMVFQQSTLDLELSVAENLHYHGSLQGLSRKLCRQRMEEELARVEMSDRLSTKVRQLNGGHRRRVEIARALLHRPKLLLLDEATVGLDPEARKSINQHVRKLCREDGISVLWATHLIEEIDEQDPVTILFNGKVKAQGLSQAICSDSQCATLADAFEQLTQNNREGNRP
ncbi:MAG: ATP-binding cassette domain-containing protein [Motiliproteus sp.]|nr:ATP-binding cassette domain-containing protein [Motiliproteus sp.]MCW9051181.1 ATP-binding cassette domain-containing protein [Motiliproteus sp.]